MPWGETCKQKWRGFTKKKVSAQFSRRYNLP
jgi:hypothetical protein